MAYQRTTWTNREVEKPRTYTLQDNGDGTTTLIPAEGNILSAGTPITAANMNNIEEYLNLLAGTSEIVTTATNANGTYIRWANGYQMCYGPFSFSSMTTGASGNLHAASLPSIALPASFLNANYTVIPVGGFAQVVGLTVIATTTSTFQPKVFTISAIAGTAATFNYLAFGRWSA